MTASNDETDHDDQHGHCPMSRRDTAGDDSNTNALGILNRAAIVRSGPCHRPLWAGRKHSQWRESIAHHRPADEAAPIDRERLWARGTDFGIITAYFAQQVDSAARRPAGLGGDPNSIARRLTTFAELGIITFLLQFHPYWTSSCWTKWNDLANR